MSDSLPDTQAQYYEESQEPYHELVEQPKLRKKFSLKGSLRGCCLCFCCQKIVRQLNSTNNRHRLTG
jgi:hypothetical protein